jgi:hypothetical protein
VLRNFFDPLETQFLYTDNSRQTIARKELLDNVIPSNSVMAHSLARLGAPRKQPVHKPGGR